jgi:hypothetical protein
VSPRRCVIPPTKEEQLDGLKALLTRDGDLIAPSLTSNWRFVETSIDPALRGLQKRQCGYAAGESSALRTLVQALSRDQLAYSFSPVWFEIQDLAQASFDTRDARNRQIEIEQEKKRQKEAEKELEKKRNDDKKVANGEIERQLRQTSVVRVRGLASGISEFVKNLAEKRAIDKKGWFSNYSEYSAIPIIVVRTPNV